MFSIGIDVSKVFLDVHIRPEGRVMHFTNDHAGINSLLSELAKYSSCRIVLEATGGYEQKVKFALIQAGIDVKTINPTRSRAFAKACGQLAKTDKIDSEILSLFAERMDIYEAYRPSEEEIVLKDLVKRRRQILEEIIKEKNRLDKIFYPLVREDLTTGQFLEMRAGGSYH